MIRIGAANRLDGLQTLANAGAQEVLSGSSELSRYGTIPLASLIPFAHEARKLHLRPILEWDILMTQPSFETAVTMIQSLAIHEFDAIRVQDPGAFEWVLQNLPNLKIQLNLETGNHNIEGVLSWCRHGGKNLERVMLSSQLPASTLQEWVKKIPVGVEILGLGPVLILYTPRHLLSNQLPETAAAEQLRATASSEESFHSGFRVLENKHGTLVFLGKDYCLMGLIEELQSLGLAALRIDFRLNEDVKSLGNMASLFTVKRNADAEAILKNYSQEVTRCFYKTNNTDKAFVRLKNENLIRRDQGYLGEVVEAAKDSHLIIHVRAKNHKIVKGQKLYLVSPQGDSQELTLSSLKNIESLEVNEIPSGDFAVIPYARLFPTKSTVYSAF